MNYKKQISKNIKALRKAERVTQIQLAKVLKMSQPQLSKVERGNGELSATQLYAAAQFFDLEMEAFLTLNWVNIL